MLFDTIFDSFGRFGGILPDVVYDVRCGQSGVGNDPNPSREIISALCNDIYDNWYLELGRNEDVTHLRK